MDKDPEIFYNIIPYLSNENFGLELNYNDYDEKIACSKAFPSDCTLAILANLSYKDDISIPSNLENWKVLTYASDKRITNGYRGVAFLNSKMCHVVIAHRGTDLLNPGAVISDICLALKLFKHKQAQSAASFAYIVAQEIKHVNRLNNYEKPPFRLTITGHSLGAWLAQYTTFTVKYLTLNQEQTQFVRDDNYLSNIHPHTVVFESPGCKESFQELVERLVYRYTCRKYGNYDTLDMTVYLNQPNPINSVNRQIGTIFMLPVNGHSLNNMINYLAMGKANKEVLLHMSSGMGSSIMQVVQIIKTLVVGSKGQPKLKKVLAKDDRCSLNVFTEAELEFVNDWYRVTRDNSCNSASIQKFRDKYNIPKFELNQEYNVLKGKLEDIKNIILIVKNLRPDEQIVYRMLKNDGGEEIYLNLFKSETALFEKKLLDFNGYYFDDIKYNLLQFLKSSNKILHVHVDRKSSIDESNSLEFDFETNIIRNVIIYYRQQEIERGIDLSEEKIAFIDWHKLSKFIYNSTKFLNNYSLLVVEYSAEDQNGKIFEFLRTINIKVIILSTDAIRFNDSVHVTEINGFGSRLTFGDLNVESREKFLNRDIFQLNNQPMCLNDLVTNITNENEILKNNFPMVSVLELILADESNTVDLDCHYSNLLKAVLFYDLYYEIQHNHQLLYNVSESTVFILHEDDTRVDLSNVFSNLNDLVYIESIEDYERGCFDNTTKIKYLITTKKNKIYLTSIFNDNFYIHRSIIHRRSVKLDIFKNQNDFLDHYIFFGDKKIFDENLVLEESDRFKFTFSVDEAVENAKLPATNIHVFKIHQDGAIDWQRSYGSITFLQKHMESKEVSIKECDIMNDDQIIIISGEPGIGKSSVIEYLYFYLTSQNKYWVFPIQLKNCTFNGISDKLNYTEVAKFIAKNCSYDTDSIQHILSFCLQYGSTIPIYIMMDSFDEIDNEESKTKVISVINFLKLNSNVKILITTRPHLSKDLENGICVFSSYFKKLNYKTEIVTFLVDFWKSQLCLFKIIDDDEEDHLKSIAENMLTSAQNTIGETVSTFIEIPMNMRLLAETVTPDAYMTSQFSDVLTLYNKYIKQRCDIYFRRFSLDAHPTVKNWLIESILGKISALSIKQSLKVDIQHINDEGMEELYKVGLVYLDSNNLKYKFLHDSVCDYFISDSIKQWLTSQMYILFVEYNVETFLISDLFLNEELEKVRLFLNFQLKTIVITDNRIELCKNELMKLSESNCRLLFNDKMESIFHICIRENLLYLLKYFLMEILDSTNAKNILTKANDKLETPLYYAIKNTSEGDDPDRVVNCLTVFLDFLNNLEPITDVWEIFLATLFNYFVSQEEVDRLNKYVENFAKLQPIMSEINVKIPLIQEYLSACKKNDLQGLANILSGLANDEMMKMYLLKSTNEWKETGLHLTSDITIAEILIKPFNINLQDHHGMTPLCRAIKERRGDIAKKLLEKGASYVGDDRGLTPLIHAAKYNLMDIVKMILNPKSEKKVDVNECNQFQITPLMIAARHGNEDIVNYLIVKEANIHLRDRNGLTAFHHAVKGYHTRIMKILKKKGSDINTRDKHGTTPLFHCVKHKNFPVIHSLLSQRADVNIGNLHGQYPLQRLIKDNLKLPVNDAYIKKFLDGELTAPANTSILSHEEKQYIQKFSKET